MAAKPAKKSVALSGIVVAETAICSIDPEQGILRYRGYDIADLAEHSTYEEVAYLLIEGELPTEEELRSFKQELSQRELPANARALIDGDPRGFVKILSDPATGVVLGGSIVGRNAAELISVLAVAVTNGLRVVDIVDSLLVHPTLSESLAEAAS
jgi:hypothetical protein